jgi:pimeloyl-ACP methyl ester carboxylesterase
VSELEKPGVVVTGDFGRAVRASSTGYASPSFKSNAGRDAVLAVYRAILADWPVPHEERRIDTRFGETFVVVSGPVDAPPLVVLHGAQANAAAYVFEVEAWAAHFRVYAIDTIGDAGLSTEARPPLDSDAHTLWLDDVLDGLGVTRTRIVGRSMGGWLALDYATRRPERVETLALLCPAGIGKQKNFMLRVVPLLFLGPWGLKRAWRLVVGDPPPITTALQQRFSTLLSLVSKHFRVRYVIFPRLADAQLARLPRTLVILGGKDVLIDSDHTKARLEAHCPQATVRFLPAGRHYLPNQGGTILEFLLGETR